MTSRKFKGSLGVCRSGVRVGRFCGVAGSLIALLLSCSLCRAQMAGDNLTIRVESERVLVPVALDTGPDTCVVPGVSPKSFRLYEDNKQQKIESLEIPPPTLDNILYRDNFGFHREFDDLPNAVWSTPDGAFSSPTARACRPYVIVYQPPVSSQGSCHQIRIKSSPSDILVAYRTEYCNVYHSMTDPASGTPLERRLEGYINSGEEGRIHPFIKANFFYGSAGTARADLAVDLPFDEVKPRKWSDDQLNVLIIAYGKDGQVVARESDINLGPRHFEHLSKFFSLQDVQQMFTPIRYEAQMVVPPGEYRFAIAVSKGNEFGITKVPLTIPEYDRSQLSIGSVALCRRFREAGSPPPAKDFVPLVSNNYEFTPAADHNFHPDDPFMVYFELYEPPSPGAKESEPSVQFQVKITNTKTGHVALNTGEMSAAQWMQPGQSKIPVSIKLGLNKLPAGDYKLEAQGSDSAGRKTPVRTADFSIIE